MREQAHKLRPASGGRLRKIAMPLLVLMGGFFGFSMLVATKPQTKPAENREITWSVAAQKVAYEIYQPAHFCLWRVKAAPRGEFARFGIGRGDCHQCRF